MRDPLDEAFEEQMLQNQPESVGDPLDAVFEERRAAFARRRQTSPKGLSDTPDASFAKVTPLVRRAQGATVSPGGCLKLVDVALESAPAGPGMWPYGTIWSVVRMRDWLV